MSSTPNDHLLQTALLLPVDSRTEILFVLDTLPDVQTLAAAAPTGSTVVLLDGSGNALQQMADYLATLPPASVDAIHLFSHGSEGSLQLGRLTLDSSNLQIYGDTLAQIGSALTKEGDILLYGCNVAKGATGINFIGRLAQITGGDIAASNDATGSANLGGDWNLEVRVGEIFAGLNSSFAKNYQSVLANETMTFDSGANHTGFTLTYFNSGGGEIWLANMNNSTPPIITVTTGTFNLVSFDSIVWGSAETYTVSSNKGDTYTYSGTATHTLNWSGLTWIQWWNNSDLGDADSIDNVVFNLPPLIEASISISDASITEGNSDTQTLSFTASLSSPAPAGGVTFDIATANNTAQADSDYVAKSLTGQTIPAGSNSYTFGVIINGDTQIESNETFFVNLTNVIGATVTDGQGLGTITNDDVNSAPTLSLDNATRSYTENTSAIQIDSAGTVNDVNGDADWNGGKLDVQITSGAIASDEISIADTDGDGTTITVSGTNILANGTDVGDLSVSGGTVSGGTKLTITFDSDATNGIVQETLQSLRYRNTGDVPGNTNRRGDRHRHR